MVILLIGIWGVARGFPLLLQNVRIENERTEMSRWIDARAEELRDTDRIPGYLLGPADVAPSSIPADPAPNLFPSSPNNARDSLLRVADERAVIPAQPVPVDPAQIPPLRDLPAMTQTDTILPVSLYRAEPILLADYDANDPQVRAYEVVPLRHMDTTPPAPQPDQGWFRLMPDGTFMDGALPTVALYGSEELAELGRVMNALEVSYAWVDTDGAVHNVTREPVSLAVVNPQVSAADRTDALNPPVFDHIVEGSVSGSGVTDYLYAGVFDTDTVDVVPGDFALDPNGVFFVFDPEDAGREVRLSYEVKQAAAAADRRAVEIWEDHRLSTAEAVVVDVGQDNRMVTVQLQGAGLLGPDYLPAAGLDFPAAPATHVIAVDLSTGHYYYQDSNVPTVTPYGIAGDQVQYAQGRIPIVVPPDALNHEFRFFYRSTDYRMLTITRAPERYFARDAVSDALATAPYVWIETYEMLSYDPDSDGLDLYTILDFVTTDPPGGDDPISASAGLTINVDYTYGDPSDPQRVRGEPHTIPLFPNNPVLAGNPPGYFPIALNQPNVLTVEAVRGVSMKVRGYWLTEDSRLQHMDVETLVGPS
jgi:hypothetical protein